MTLIRCPWPPTELRPNFTRSNHWRKWRPINTAYRTTCWHEGLSQSIHMQAWPDGRIQLVYTFHPPKGCRWDKDAREGAFKAGQDGIADAMKVDDKRFDVKKIHGDPVEVGFVIVQIVTQSVESIPFRGVIS